MYPISSTKITIQNLPHHVHCWCQRSTFITIWRQCCHDVSSTFSDIFPIMSMTSSVRILVTRYWCLLQCNLGNFCGDIFIYNWDLKKTRFTVPMFLFAGLCDFRRGTQDQEPDQDVEGCPCNPCEKQNHPDWYSHSEQSTGKNHQWLSRFSDNSFHWPMGTVAHLNKRCQHCESRLPKWICACLHSRRYVGVT
jgi:hypothetical protein